MTYFQPKKEQAKAGRQASVAGEAVDVAATAGEADVAGEAVDVAATAGDADVAGESPEGVAPGATEGAAPKAAEGAGPTAAEVAPDELSRAVAERDEYLDHLQRLQAEFDNYRKRVRRDQEQLRLNAAETVVESLLPVVDNLRRAVEATREHGGEQLAAGVALVYDQLVNTLAGHGLTAVEVEPGTPFDPEVHEAVMTQSSDDYDEGAVLQVMERGYLLHGRLLRPAKVVVVR